MKWFEKEFIKSRENLTSEQIAYLHTPSLTILAPFNIIVHKHLDFLFSLLLLCFFNWLLTEIIPLNDLTSLYLIVNGLFFFGLSYFFIMHGKRLAWNRNKWKDFAAFQKSQRRWLPWAVAVFVFMQFRNYDEAFASDFSDNIKLNLFIEFAIPLLVIAWPFIWHRLRTRKNLAKSVTDTPHVSSPWNWFTAEVSSQTSIDSTKLWKIMTNSSFVHAFDHQNQLEWIREEESLLIGKKFKMKLKKWPIPLSIYAVNDEHYLTSTFQYRQWPLPQLYVCQMKIVPLSDNQVIVTMTIRIKSIFAFIYRSSSAALQKTLIKGLEQYLETAQQLGNSSAVLNSA